VVQRLEVGLAGKQVVAFGPAWGRRDRVELLAYPLRLVVGRVQAIVGQLCELLQQAFEQGAGGPGGVELAGLVERVQVFANRGPDRQLRAALRQAFQHALQCRLLGGGRRGEGQAGGEA